MENLLDDVADMLEEQEKPWPLYLVIVFILVLPGILVIWLITYLLHRTALVNKKPHRPRQ